MLPYDLNNSERASLLADLRQEYSMFRDKNLDLNMARGKPSAEQIDLSRPLLDTIDSDANLQSSDGIDCANYGGLEGIAEARELLGIMLDDDSERVVVGGNSSLNLMYDALARYWMFGAPTTHGTSKPWGLLDKVSWLCPVPGYDRHFAILESFGIDMIAVPMDEHGPVLDDALLNHIAHDASIKGIWCVPQYSNPSGITYTDEVVYRLASLECAADDFRIFWDNAYSVHHLHDEASRQAHVLDIGAACRNAGNPNRYVKFASTSKITFPGGGISGLASSPDNIEQILACMASQTIGFDKLNQLRHARFLPSVQTLGEHMRKHAAILRPKFECVLGILHNELASWDCTWNEPDGGYFICFTGPKDTARRIVELARECGVTLTQAGATHPHGYDPEDAMIRIAPTLPPIGELELAMKVFVCCTKIACLEACQE